MDILYDDGTCLDCIVDHELDLRSIMMGSYDLAAAFLLTVVWFMGAAAATMLFGITGFVGMWLFIMTVLLTTERRVD